MMSHDAESAKQMKQMTLTGEEADDHVRPDTFLWCQECGNFILRSRRALHPHELVERDDEDETEGEREPERVGGIYDITLSYSVDFRFRIPAWSEHEAKDRALDLVDYPNNCADMYQLHSEDREVKELFEDDAGVPDDFDPYGRTMLWEVYGND